MPMTERSHVLRVWVLIAASAVFLVHAFNYLYFFVDDEAIPYVYAQNLLHGRGLSYNAIEGRLEGYSDFLHVLWSTVILAVVRGAHLPKHAVFFVGKAVSLVCGIGILLLVWLVAARLRLRQVSAITALGMLALAPPLALWSCSSLEAVPVALMATGLMVALVLDRDQWAALAASLLILERIDGFVYAGLLTAAFLVTASGARRREMVRHIAVPASVVFLAYHGWRFWYFQDLVPAPVEAKILYKLVPQQNVVVKSPDYSYAREFISAYGWPAVLAVAASAAHALTAGGWIRRLALAALPLAAYVSIVGDWMFGFRFFILLLPLFALLMANSIDRVAAIRPRLAAGLCITALLYSGVIAARFSATYVRVAQTPGFLRSPSRDLHLFFRPYYGLYEMARQVVFPGDVVAYNQAGFVPFMLDVNNIDDLGICSRFPAEVPSTDIFFTEVGRYAPLTSKAPLRPVQAYLLYAKVRVIMSRSDILARANYDKVPGVLFGGRYTLVGMDRSRLNAIYKRSDERTDRITLGLFTENVAHVSYVRAARIDEKTIDPKDYLRALRFLRDETAAIPFSGRTTLDIEFSDTGEIVSEIAIANLGASTPAHVLIQLLTSGGHVVGQTDIALAADRGVPVSFRVPHATANRLVVAVDGHGASGKLSIEDLRVQGQRRALRQYVTSHLHFSEENAQDY